MSRPARMPRRTLTALVLLSAALLSTGACSSDGGTGPPKQQPVRTAQPSQAETDPATGSDGADEADVPEVSVDRAPDLQMADRVILRRDGTRGNASMEFGKARQGDGDTMSVGVECEGKGRIEVTLRPLHTSFSMECREGEVTGEYNQLTQDAADRAGTVSVTAPSGVRWSLSIGRGEPAEQDLDG
ncbi:hypothetical protein ACFVZA_39355 [Streptomyces bottropensis]|uniref:hypothetical protein n=1 Tax=Streptomyces bottropensis TaxID=42235 RepID=UPI003699CF04